MAKKKKTTTTHKPVKLKKMIYKKFTWTNNPYECTWSCDRAYVGHKYPELSGIEAEDFGPNAIIISGSGEFFGKDAYATWRKLVAQFKTKGAGKFYHPIYKDVNWALMTSLKSTLEPRENYVSYTFEIIADTKKLSGTTEISKTSTEKVNNKVTTKVTVKKDRDKTTTTTTVTEHKDNVTLKFKKGDIVVAEGRLHVGANSETPTKYVSSMKMTVTNTSPGAKYPIHVGTNAYSWASESSLTMWHKPKTPTTTSITHVMKPGETIQSVCAHYGVNWVSVASMNGIRDVNRIMAGDRIVIVY